ncbi:MAG: winged helix-turn-helix transcriptional regulator [Anaerolineae bacterium]|nr:winged helix-turn-helix transcriptional regulator [Anaerolineae bacterium]
MSSNDLERRLLEAIEQNPDTTQASLAAQLGIAVGSVNWYVKRLIRKGYIKVTHLQRRRLKYFLTPQGLALKAHLTSQYVKASLRLYRELRQAAEETVNEVRKAGYDALSLEGADEAAEIFRLTCLEHGIRHASSADDGVPTVSVDGMSFVVRWPEAAHSASRGDRSWRLDDE